MRGNLIDDHSGNPPLLFQFTPLHERQLANSRISWWRVYFNSRLYMRGNSHGCERQLPWYISIHASTWEATRGNRKRSISKSYFNSRLYMRGNVSHHFIRLYLPYFNSRLYMRGNNRNWNWRQCTMISIHASTWEATRYIRYMDDIIILISIHASTWEATLPAFAVKCMKNLFQFTPLHERQQKLCRQHERGRTDFNSRLYMRGNQQSTQNSVSASTISIHASTWEATPWQLTKVQRPRISIHASTWEATWYHRSCDKGRRISIHASTWEATLQSLRSWKRKVFQFTPLHERQLVSLFVSQFIYLFQFTPLHERQHSCRW